MVSDGGNHFVEGFLSEHLEHYLMVAAVQKLLVTDHVSDHIALGAACASHTDFGAVDIQNGCAAVSRQFPVRLHEAHVALRSLQGKAFLALGLGPGMVKSGQECPDSKDLYR